MASTFCVICFCPLKNEDSSVKLCSKRLVSMRFCKNLLKMGLAYGEWVCKD